MLGTRSYLISAVEPPRARAVDRPHTRTGPLIVRVREAVDAPSSKVRIGRARKDHRHFHEQRVRCRCVQGERVEAAVLARADEEGLLIEAASFQHARDDDIASVPILEGGLHGFGKLDISRVYTINIRRRGSA